MGKEIIDKGTLPLILKHLDKADRKVFEALLDIKINVEEIEENKTANYVYEKKVMVKNTVPLVASFLKQNEQDVYEAFDLELCLNVKDKE